MAAAIALGQQRSFVSCPIVRDTKTVPCFLAEYDGETYYLGIQQDITNDFHPPQLKHEVLVEGRVASTRPARLWRHSPQARLDFRSERSQPGLQYSAARRAGNRRSSRGPRRRARPHAVPKPRSAPREPLTGRQEFTVLYAFDDDYLEYAANRVVTEAAAYAKRIGASSVKVSGYRATTLLSNGDRLVEKAGLAEKRAQNIATLLRGFGVSHLTVEWTNEAEPGDGQTDPSRRRVTIVVTP